MDPFFPRTTYRKFTNYALEEDLQNKSSSFVLKKNKKSGNFSILKETPNEHSVERVRYKIYGAFLPFGREEYNDNLILNVIIDDSNNFNHNLILTFKKIC